MSVINIIIPVYNSECFLEAVFDSLLNQTFQDYSLYVVNDCSVDNSEEIILNYKPLFGERLNYIKNRTNLKQSGSRNAGLEMAEKKPALFTTFIDSDDWVDIDYLESMFDLITTEEADIAICGIERFENRTNSIICREAVSGKNIYVRDEIGMEELAFINPAPYNKLYRSDVIKGIRFREMKRSEDTCYFFEVLQNVNKIVYTNKISYHYRIGQKSLTAEIDPFVCDSMMQGFVNLYTLLEELHVKYLEELESQIFIRVACGGVCRSSFENIRNSDKLIHKVTLFLDESIPNWRANKYLCFRNWDTNVKRIGLKVCAALYKADAFKLFIYFYYFLLKVCKKDIRM